MYGIKQIDTVFELLISDSGLKATWNNYIRKRYRTSEERLYFFDMMEISAMVVKLLQQNKSAALKRFFQKVAQILNDADFEVTNLMLAGLIEGIQQICQYQDIDMRNAFDEWLLPATKKNWDEMTGLFNHEL